MMSRKVCSGAEGSRPMSFWARMTCAELETGSNSAAPWMTARSRTLRYSSIQIAQRKCRLRRCGCATPQAADMGKLLLHLLRLPIAELLQRRLPILVLGEAVPTRLDVRVALNLVGLQVR